MNWSKSHLFRWGVELLSFCSFLSLFAPLFILAGLYVKDSPFLNLYWKYVMLAAVPWLAAHLARIHDQSLPEKRRRFTAILLLAFGLAMVLAVLVVPAVKSGAAFYVMALYLISGLLTWMLGIGKAMYLQTNYDTQRQLLVGIIGFAFLFFLANHTGIGSAFYRLSLPFIVFWLPSAAVVLGILRMLELQDEEDLAKIKNWLSKYLTIIAGCLLLALLAGGVMPWVFHYLKIPLSYIWLAVKNILIFFAAVLAYLVQYAVALLARVVTNMEIELKIPEPPDFSQEEQLVSDISPLGRDVLLFLQWALLALAVFLLLRFLYRFLMQNYRTRQKSRQAGVRESYSSADALRNWGRRQLKRMAMSLKQRVDAVNIFKKEENAVEVYHSLLAAAVKRGAARPVGQTAHKFQDRILAVFPHHKKEANNIFYSFVEELYAGRITPPEKLNSLRMELSRVKKEKKSGRDNPADNI